MQGKLRVLQNKAGVNRGFSPSIFSIIKTECFYDEVESCLVSNRLDSTIVI